MDTNFDEILETIIKTNNCNFIEFKNKLLLYESNIKILLIESGIEIKNYKLVNYILFCLNFFIIIFNYYF